MNRQSSRTGKAFPAVFLIYQFTSRFSRITRVTKDTAYSLHYLATRSCRIRKYYVAVPTKSETTIVEVALTRGRGPRGDRIKPRRKGLFVFRD